MAKIKDGLKEQSDIYTSDGILLCSLQDVEEIEIKYEQDYNKILVQYRVKNAVAGRKTYAAYYPDGICLAGPVEADKAEMKESFRYYIDDQCYEISDTIHFNQPHPTLNILTDAQIEKEVRKSFFDNIWIKKATTYSKEKKYQQALDCYRFFGEFDNYTLLKSGNLYTSTNVLYYAVLLETYYNTGNYKAIIDGVTGKSFELAPFV